VRLNKGSLSAEPYASSTNNQAGRSRTLDDAEQEDGQLAKRKRHLEELRGNEREKERKRKRMEDGDGGRDDAERRGERSKSKHREIKRMRREDETGKEGRKRTDDGGNDRDDADRQAKPSKGNHREMKRRGEGEAMNEGNVGGAEGKNKTVHRQKLSTEHERKMVSDQERAKKLHEHVPPMKPAASSHVELQLRDQDPSVSHQAKHPRDSEDDDSLHDRPRTRPRVSATSFEDHLMNSPWSDRVCMQIASQMQPAVTAICGTKWEQFCSKTHVVPMLKAETGLWNALCVFWQMSPGIRKELDAALDRVASNVLKSQG
jgi:hypothetical protein